MEELMDWMKLILSCVPAAALVYVLATGALDHISDEKIMTFCVMISTLFLFWIANTLFKILNVLQRQTEGNWMGRLINHGWSRSQDEIPEPISILLGRNLRQNSERPSKPPKQSRRPRPAKKKSRKRTTRTSQIARRRPQTGNATGSKR